MQGLCKLCGQQKELRYSHIVPAFAVRWLKQTSLTGYLKTFKSKVRVQETKRVYLLCADCEQILGRDEKIFCEKIFIPYHEKNQQQFEYGSWLRRFIVGLHWKVLVTKEEKYPADAEAAYARAESEWGQFLLGQSASPGDAEFHLFLSNVVEDSTGELPQKINWYLARGFDLTPIYSEAGMAGVYAMIVRTLTFSYLTPKAAKDKMIGTQITEEGVLQTPQTIQRSLGSFIVGRAKAIERMPKTMSARQHEKLLERARTEPEKLAQSESFRAFDADMQLKQRRMRDKLLGEEARRRMKGRNRNSPCPCGSGMKYKKCHGRPNP
jgi:hypothetical protein